MVVGKYEDLGAQRDREQRLREEAERQRLSKGITSALAEGQVPPTELINEALDQAREAVATAQINPTLSSEGRGVASDLSNVIGDIKDVLSEKNEGETLQKLAYHSREAAREAQFKAALSGGAGSAASGSAQKAGQDIKEVLGIASDLARLVATSSEFRRLFQDLSIFLLEVLSVKIEQTRTAIEHNVDPNRPLGESLKDVAKEVADQPVSREDESVATEKNVPMHVDPQVEAQTRKEQQRGEFSGKEPQQLKQQQRGDVESTGASSSSKGKKHHGGKGAAAASSSRSPSEGLTRSSKVEDLPSSMPPTAGVPADVKDKKERVQEELIEKVGQQQGSTGSGSRVQQRQQASAGTLRRTDDTEPMLKDQLSEEDRRKLVARLRTWAKEIHKRTDFRQGVHDLFDALDDFRRHLMAAADEATGMLQAYDPTSHRVQAQREARRLLEQFAGGHSLEPTIMSLRRFVDSTKHDRNFDKYFESLGDFIKRCVDDPAYVQLDRVSDDLDNKMEEGKRILQAHRNEIDQFFNNANAFVTALSNDRTIHRLSADTQKLVRRLFLDDEGRPTLKAGTLLDVRKILGPILRSQLSFVALPTLTFSDETVSWVMENVVLKGEDIVPDQIVVENYARAVIKPLSDEDDAAASLLRIRVTGMRAHVPNVHFAYKRKVFPRMEDVCTFDAHIGEAGITIQMVLKLSTADHTHVFRVSEVRCDIDSLVLHNIQGVEHSNALYTFLKPIIQNNARANMEQGIVNTLFDWMWDLDQMLMEYRDQIALM